MILHKCVVLFWLNASGGSLVLRYSTHSHVSTQLNSLQPLDEFHKTFRLVFEPVEQLGIFQPAALVQQFANAGQENPLWKNVSVAITEDGLKLLDRPQRSPDA